MFAKCLTAIVICAMIVGSHQQVVVPAYSAAYYPSAYVYPSVYSPYAAAVYPSVWAWGSNMNKKDAAPQAFARPSALLNNQKPTST